MEPTRRAPVHWGVRCCPSSCLSPADRPFSDVFHTPVCNGRVHPTHIRDRCVRSACKAKHCGIPAPLHHGLVGNGMRVEGVLSPRMVHVIEDLAGDWHRLDERIEGLSSEIEVLARHDPGCDRLMSVPGIGPIISSAMVAAIGGGDAFSKGRDFAAWLGLVPKQISTADRTILGKISKRGNRYLRVLFVQAAWAVLIRPKSWDRHGLKPWLEAAKKRLHHNVLAIALANKLARIAWSVLAHGRAFEAIRIQAA